MASSVKGMTATMRTALNPNAAEFVPSTLRPSSSSSNIPDVIKPKPARDCRKAIIHGSDFTTSCASDNESQYQQFQLPDDIIPDFGLLEVNAFLSAEGISSEGSAAFDYTSTSKPFVTENITENKQGNCFSFHRRQEISPREMSLGYANGHSKFALAQNGEERFSGGVESLSPSRAWEHHSFALDQQMVQIRNGQHLSSGCDVGFFGELLKQPFSDEKETDSMNLPALEFPGFAAESLADIFHGNGNDLNMTIEMLTQLQLQDNSGPPAHVTSQSSSAPKISMTDFSDHEITKMVSCYTGKEVHQAMNVPRTREEKDSFFGTPKVSADSRSDIDFAAVVRKGSQHSAQCLYERTGNIDLNLGTNSSQFSTSSFAEDARVTNGDRIHAYDTAWHTHQLPPYMWLDTGKSGADTYSELREAQDHAQIWNTYFEKASQVYLIGNKAIAKEFSAKGQCHNGQMKAVHDRTGKEFFCQRNLVTALPNYSREQTQLIDLHGLHESEAIRVLKHELAVLRNIARSRYQHQQVLICIGTGHHTKGSRTPARLPMTVERYLVEDEHLDYTEPQPGMLLVVV